MKNLTLELFCELTPDELEAKAKEHASATMKYREVEDEKREVVHSYTDRMKALRSDMERLAAIVVKGGEARPVQCRVLYHTPTVGTKRVVRLDTGDMVREEPMTDDERQENLFGEMNELERMYQAPDIRPDCMEPEQQREPEDEGPEAA